MSTAIIRAANHATPPYRRTPHEALLILGVQIVSDVDGDHLLSPLA
jgi:hypothetical protein